MKKLISMLLIAGLFTGCGSHTQIPQTGNAQTQTNSTMKNVVVKQTIDAPVEKAWAILRTGTGLENWIPIIATCKLEGTERTCTTADGKNLKETILLVDDQNRTFKYRIDEQDMMPVKNYVGTVTVAEVMGKTEIRWVADFEMTVAEAFPDVEKGLNGLLSMAISGLETAAQK